MIEEEYYYDENNNKIYYKGQECWFLRELIDNMNIEIDKINKRLSQLEKQNE